MTECDITLAEQVKTEGNTLYSQKKYSEAIRCYDKAIELNPTNVSYYGNRAASYLMIGKYKEGLSDTKESVRLDPNFQKGYLRMAKCAMCLGEFSEAIIAYEKVLHLEPGNKEATEQLKVLNHIEDQLNGVEARLTGGDIRTALYHIETCLKYAPAAIKLKIRRAELLIDLGRHADAAELITDLCRTESSQETNAELFYLRGLALYYQEQYEKAQNHFIQTLKMNPDFSRAMQVYKRCKQLMAKKDSGNEFIGKKQYQAAYDAYSEALEVDPKHALCNAKLHCNRALSLIHLNRLDEALADCNRALQLDSNYANALKRRGQIYTKLEQFDEALRDFEALNQKNPSRENKHLVQEAKLAQKKAKRKNYYKILGISENAGDVEIKKGYKKKAMIHHPDKHAHSTDEEKHKAELAFKDVGEAYSVLSDPKKKQRYDAGYDLEEIQNGSAGMANGMHIDPNEIFAQFFGGSGGHSHGGMGGGGMPGGFSFHFG